MPPLRLAPLARRWLSIVLLGLTALATAFLAGCKGTPTPSETQARAGLQAVTQAYHPAEHQAALPALDTNATLGTLLTYAMLNQPRVAAAYHDYAAAVERITLERSLPDPRLTLEIDIQSVATIVMPGLMTDLPWLKKLRLRADQASAESLSKYYAFETAVLQTAFEVKRPYYQLHFLQERLRIDRETLALAGELEQSARVQNESGKATLQDVLRAQIEQERLKTQIANLEDSRHPLLAQLKAALGLRDDQPDPPVPAQLETTPLDLDSEKVFAAALARNPRLKAMEADMRMAEAGIQLARLSKRPDFNFGLESDVKAAPVLWRPTFGVTLPIWRDKIAAELASAQSLKHAAAARLSSEQIQLASDFSALSFAFREGTRNVKLLTDVQLPKARLSLELARAGYSAGRADFINLLDAQRTLFEFQLMEVDARVERELALAEISLLIVGTPPADAPLLPNGPPSVTPAKK